MKKMAIVLFALASFLVVTANSHAAVYFPHVATVSSWETEICLINTHASTTVTGNLNSYRDNGTLVSSTAVTLLPNARRQITVGQEMATPDEIGYMIFESSAETVVGYTKFFITETYRAAIPAVSKINTGDIFITHIASIQNQWWTGISLVNTTDSQKTLTIEFDNGTSKSLTLQPLEHRAFTIESLFDGQAQPNIHSARLRNSAGVIGLELFGGATVLDGVPLHDKTATDLYYPHIASDATWWTGIVAFNQNDSPVNIQIHSYQANGTLLNTQAKTLAAGERYIGLVSDLGLPANTAWLHIEADQAISGFELFGTPAQLAGYSVVDIGTKSGVFAKIESNGWTGIAFVNAESEPATGTLTALDNAGGVVATTPITLAGHAKRVEFVENLFTGKNIAGATYVQFSFDREIVGFQLNADSANTMLDGLPALFATGDEIKSALDMVLSLIQYQDSLGQLSEIMSTITAGGGGTCPVVTVDPPLTDLSSIPPRVTITVDYGTGCTSSNGTDMSGKLVLTVTNISLAPTGITLDFLLTATEVTANGRPLLNGSVSGHVSITNNLKQITLSATFNNLQVIDSTITGGITATINNLSSGGTVDDITLSFDNLSVKGYTINSGTVVIKSNSTTQIEVTVDLITNKGPAKITVLIDQPSDTQTIINTAEAGSVAGYTITITNVTMDSSICEDYPVSGSITLAGDGPTKTITFTDACDGTYDMTP